MVQGPETTRKVLFYRDFDTFSGGHQKVFDYFKHLEKISGFQPYIAFSAGSRWDDSNPWYPEYQNRQVAFNPAAYDYLFLAGMDWQAYLAKGVIANKPVINFIQGVRHAVAGQNVHPFLVQKAIRICVSGAVKSALDATGHVPGPTFVIDNGLDIPKVTATHKTIDILIAGLKQPTLARQIYSRLCKRSQFPHHSFQSGSSQDNPSAQSGATSKNCLNIVCLTEPLPRNKFLYLLARAKIALLLPSVAEGFYLPALEAMQLCTLAIVPDCVGNRGFCMDIEVSRDQGNCLMPDYNEPAIIAACTKADQITRQPKTMALLQKNTAATLAKHTLVQERLRFRDILDQVDTLWCSH